MAAFAIGSVGTPAGGSGVSEIIAVALEAAFPGTFSRTGGKKAIESIATGIVDGITGSLLGWEDLRVPMSNARPGATPPQFSDFRAGLYQWEFLPAVTDYLYFNAQMPHSYSPGTDMSVHVHWSLGANHAAQAGAKVRWIVRVSAAWMSGTGGTVAFSSGTDYTCEGTVAGADYTHQLTPASVDIPGAGLGESAILLARITRDNTVAGNAPVGAFPFEVDYHFKQGKVGSNNASYPFTSP